jgi:large subunit ribosomal protein L22
MEVTAKARFIRMSPRKVRLIAGLVRGMDLGKAVNQLRFYRKAAARPVLKLIESAAANASHNHKIDVADLFIKKITVDGGPTLKRWRARAFGRAAGIKKRTCHIYVVLDERSALGESKAGVAAAVVKPEAKKKAPAKAKTARPAKKAAAKKA